MAKVFKWLWFKLSKHYRMMYWGLFRDFQQAVKNPSLFFHFAASTVTEIISPLCVPARAHTEKSTRGGSRASKLKKSTLSTWIPELSKHVHTGVGGGACFLMEFANRFRLTKSDHTSIWKLYFLTWAIFWKIDSDVWNQFRTVVRNVQYKWKKLVFNVFSSQLFLLSKYAFWGVRELVGGVQRGRMEWRRLLPRT